MKNAHQHTIDQVVGLRTLSADVSARLAEIENEISAIEGDIAALEGIVGPPMVLDTGPSPGYTKIATLKRDAVEQFSVQVDGQLNLFHSEADTQGVTISCNKRGKTGDASAAPVSGDSIVQLRAYAWNGSTYGATGQIQFVAGTQHSGSTAQSYVRAYAVPPSSTTETEVLRGTFDSSGNPMLTMGGATSSYPALKRNAASFDVRLADDSAYAAFTTGTLLAATGGMIMGTTDSASVFAYSFTCKKRGTTGDANAAVATASEVGNFSWQSWNGSAYVTNALMVIKTEEAQSSGHAGAQINFRTTAVGSGSVTNAAYITASHNFVIGATSTNEPASLVKGLVLEAGTAATGDPTSAGAVWVVSGEIQYRTSGSNEGSGQTNRVHNRGAQQAGVGTNYTLTNSAARVTFGTTNAEINLPTAGTYLVIANVSFNAGTTSGDIYSAVLRNLTDSTDIGSAKRFTQASAAPLKFNTTLIEVVTVTALKAVGIFAYNETAARGAVESTTTQVAYVRLF